jgi:hypothetical protein
MYSYPNVFYSINFSVDKVHNAKTFLGKILPHGQTHEHDLNEKRPAHAGLFKINIIT